MEEEYLKIQTKIKTEYEFERVKNFTCLVAQIDERGQDGYEISRNHEIYGSKAVPGS